MCVCDEVEEDLSCLRMKSCTAAIFCNVSGGLSDRLKCQTTKLSHEDALKEIRWQFRVLPFFYFLFFYFIKYYYAVKKIGMHK